MPIRKETRPHWACGKCAYDLSGCLDAERCPECGTAIAGVNDEELGPNLVDLNELPQHIRASAEAKIRGEHSTVAASEVRCVRCGYSLVGLKSGRCPECALPVSAGKGTRALDDTLTRAPMRYIQRFRFAMMGLTLGMLGTPSGLVYGAATGSALATTASVAFSALWAASVYYATMPRPNRGTGDMRITRSLARLTQVAWLLFAISASMSIQATGPQWMGNVALVFAIVGLAGLSPLGEQLGALADWAGEGLGPAIRTAATSLLLFGAIVVIGNLVAGVPFLGLLMVFVPLSTLFFWISILVFLFLTIRLTMVANAAVSSAKATYAHESRRSERLRERADQLVSKDMQSAPSFGQPGFEADLAPIDPGPWRPPVEEQNTKKPDDDLPPIPLA